MSSPPETVEKSETPKNREEENRLSMKTPLCIEPFLAWKKCIEEAQNNKQDIADKCSQTAVLLKQCVDLTMSSSPETLENQTLENQTLEIVEAQKNNMGVEENVGEDDEDTECGFCLFMKGGGCKEAFVAWEECVEQGEKNKEDIVDKCYEVTRSLKECMIENSDYYEPILNAEKEMEEKAMAEQASVESDNQEAAK